MVDVRNKPVSETPGNLPKTAADPGYVAVYDNDSTDGRPASVLESSTANTGGYSPESGSSAGWVPWVIGLIILALVIYFVVQVLF